MLLGVSEFAVGVGLTVNDEVAVCVTCVLAWSVTEAVNVVVQLLVSSEFAVNMIVLEPSALKVLDVELSEPHSELEGVYPMENDGVPPETVVASDSA